MRKLLIIDSCIDCNKVIEDRKGIPYLYFCKYNKKQKCHAKSNLKIGDWCQLPQADPAKLQISDEYKESWRNRV